MKTILYLSKLLPQNFPFSKPLLIYIFENARFAIFLKFNKTCKYFYAKYYYNITLKLALVNEWEEARIGFKRYGFSAITEKDFDCFKENLWLSGIFRLYNASDAFYKSLFPKIVRSNLISLELSYCSNLVFKDLHLLTKSGDIYNLHIFKTKVFDNEDKLVPLERIMACVLKADYITIIPCHVTENTIRSLCSTERKKKLSHLRLESIDTQLAPNDFHLFLKENGKGPLTITDIKFKDHDYTKIFNAHLNELLVQEKNMKTS